MEEDQLLTPQRLRDGHPCVQEDKFRYNVKGAMLQGGSWNLEGLQIRELNLEDCQLLSPIKLRLDPALQALRIHNLSGAFKSEHPLSPADLQVETTANLARIELSGTSNISMMLSTISVVDCDVSGAIEKLAFVSTQFRGKVTVSQLRTDDIRFGVCQFEDRLDISGLRSDWLVFHMCQLGRRVSLLGIEGHKNELKLSIDSCTAIGEFLSLVEIEADAIFLSGLRIKSEASVSLLRVNAKRFLDWSHVELDKSARIEFRHTPLCVSYFARTPLERVEIGVGCWDGNDDATKLYVHNVLKSGTADKVQFRPVQFGNWPISLPMSEVIQHTRENYSQLVKYYEERRDFELAEKFYIGEMHMLRWKLSTSKNRMLALFQRNISAIGLYWLLSVYGSSYRRALLSLLCMTLGFAVLFMVTGLDCTNGAIGCGQISYPNVGGDNFANFRKVGSDLSSAIAYVLDVATLQKELAYRPKGLLSNFVRSAVIVAFASQVALLVFALRRRFRRATSI